MVLHDSKMNIFRAYYVFELNGFLPELIKCYWTYKLLYSCSVCLNIASHLCRLCLSQLVLEVFERFSLCSYFQLEVARYATINAELQSLRDVIDMRNTEIKKQQSRLAELHIKVQLGREPLITRAQ